MLTRSGSDPAPSWMNALGDPATDPKRFLKTLRLITFFFAALWVGSMIFSYRLVYQAHGRQVSGYNSQAQFAGMPLLSIARTAHGVFAFGGYATGMVAIGGLCVGAIAAGALSVGVFAFGGLSVGLLAIGGLATGWQAIGGLAVGYRAAGGLAVGAYAHAGSGMAVGYYEASGQIEKLFR